MTRYLDNSLLAWLYLDGEWMTFDPTTKLLQVLESPSAASWEGLRRLSASCEQPRTIAELVGILTDEGLDRAQAATLVETAIELGVLIDATAAGVWHRRAAAAGNPRARDDYRFLSLLPCQEYLDYSRPTIYEEDRQQMREQIAAGDPQPAIVKEYPDAVRVALPHPDDGPPSDAAGRLAHLLYFAFGALRETRFLGLLPMLFKAVPSMGARHPLEAYLLVGTQSFLPPGVYHYEVMHNALARIVDTHASTPSDCTLVVTTVFERSQWRYQHNMGYKDVLHDLGHTMANLQLMAEHLDIDLVETSLPVEWTHTPPLEESPLAAFRIGALQ